jgi:hypothetical protein
MTASRPQLIGENRVTVGRVTEAAPASVTIDTPGGLSQTVLTTPQTVVVKASAGAPSDVVPGARVVVKYVPTSQRQQVAELVVLGSGSLHGLPVVDATADSITIRNLGGEAVTVDTTGASVDKTSAASASDVAVGAMIFVRAKLVENGDLVAEEIIVLPVDTVFGSTS